MTTLRLTRYATPREASALRGLATVLGLALSFWAFSTFDSCIDEWLPAPSQTEMETR